MNSLKVLIGRLLQISLVGNFTSLEVYISWIRISTSNLIVELITSLLILLLSKSDILREAHLLSICYGPMAELMTLLPLDMY